MTILVTGSSGHLGEAIIRTLRQANTPYIGVDIKPSPFTTHVGSITDANFVQKIVANTHYIIHTATLHKPHVATHPQQDFIDTNISGTLNLLEAAVRYDVKAFLYTSTTSTFGDALTPPPGAPAAWVTETTRPVPRNIYGITKNAAEDLCQLFYRDHRLPCLVLKTSRFFPEEDDKKSIRRQYDDQNAKANEYLYRRVDIADVVSAHLLALGKAPRMGFNKYIISATTPFSETDRAELHADAPTVVQRLYPEFPRLYAQHKWKMFPTIERVYVNEKVRTDLGWEPQYNFDHVLRCLQKNINFNSDLARAVGSKGYHNEKFTEGPYPVREA